MRIISFVIIFAAFLACKNTNSPETPKDGKKEVGSPVLGDPLSSNAPTGSDANILGATYYVLVDKLRVRDEPGSKGKVLVQLSEGSMVTSLGEQSDFEDRIQLRDQWVTAPWLKIKTQKELEGWVFGGAVAAQLPETYVSKTPYDECEAAFVHDRNTEKYQRCIEKQAGTVFQKDQRYIQKDNKGYTVKLLSGETVNLENNENPQHNAEDYREYQYRYYLDKMGYFVFQLDGHESRDFILLDDKYGEVTMLYGFPRMSPNRRNMLVVSFEPVDGEGRHAVKLLSRGDDGLQTVFEEEIATFVPMNPRWLDDKNIELDFLSPPQEQKQWRVRAKLTEVAPGEWQLNISNRRVE